MLPSKLLYNYLPYYQIKWSYLSLITEIYGAHVTKMMTFSDVTTFRHFVLDVRASR
jgi:hypothetical protein